MFLSERIKNIDKNDRVLEIGPGNGPHPRADAFLDITYSSNDEKLGQFGFGTKKIDVSYKKPIYYYDGKKFPFKDKEFDYIICSHVIEHVESIPDFVKELERVAHKGYLEFPSPYYEYLYNFVEHKSFLYYSKNKNKIYWMEKGDKLKEFEKCNIFLKQTIEKGYVEIFMSNKECFFHGFEWESHIDIEEIKNLSEMQFETVTINPARISFIQKIKNIIKKILRMMKIIKK
jgi:ubiquinone/menaquinone biosynthesis C-methylase UbiE